MIDTRKTTVLNQIKRYATTHLTIGGTQHKSSIELLLDIIVQKYKTNRKQLLLGTLD
jgi:hypothetical protein